MLHFECDYTQGFDPKVLDALVKTNMEATSGYGLDPYCQKATEVLKQQAGNEIAVHYLVGGTQTNMIVINSLLHSYQGVIACDNGHIHTHETGAVEYTGHKVLVLPSHEGKLDPKEVERYVNQCVNDPQYEHIVQPKMVYISQPTELGTMYTKNELEQLRSICDDYDLYLFMDGARLGYGLAADTELTLKDYVKYCDVFYIGLTKCGGGFGEAVVFKNEQVCPHFRSYMKQGGAMLAKGRLLGVQALALFEDNHYQHICAHALKMADRIKTALKEANIPLLIDSPTNQMFPILTTAQRETIEKQFVVNRWADIDSDHHAIRIVTSWGTTEAAVDELVETIRSLNA